MSSGCWSALMLIGVVGLMAPGAASDPCYQQGPANNTILNANCKDKVTVVVKQPPLKMLFTSTATGAGVIEEPFELIIGNCKIPLGFSQGQFGANLYLGTDPMKLPVDADVDKQGVTFSYGGSQKSYSCGALSVFAGDQQSKQTATIEIKPKNSSPKGLEKLKLTIDAPVLPAEKDDDMDIKTIVAIVVGCVCGVLCFSSSLSGSSYGSFHFYRKHKEHKELEKQKNTKKQAPSVNPSISKINQSNATAMTTQHPYTDHLPLNDGFFTKGTKKAIPQNTEFSHTHMGLKKAEKVEKPAESDHEPYQPLPELRTARPLDPTTPQLATPKPSDTQQTAQLATPKPSNTNQQSPAPVEKKVEEAANKNKLKDSDFYVFGQDESKDEDEKKDNKKKRLTVDRTQDDKA
ncbi:hypothetical protein M3Y96_01209800 [Aphelenchoides besseyi]|nr:hypothetical protein M3Y96_01209800 [Aphelenchoides besseyi]